MCIYMRKSRREAERRETTVCLRGSTTQEYSKVLLYPRHEQACGVAPCHFQLARGVCGDPVSKRKPQGDEDIVSMSAIIVPRMIVATSLKHAEGQDFSLSMVSVQV